MAAGTSCTITGLTGVVTKAVVSCYDTSGTTIPILPNDFGSSTADTLVINFSAPQTGYCNASTGVGQTGATGAAGATGPIASINGSAVAAQVIAGTANQITVTSAAGTSTLSFPAGGVTLPGTTTGTFSGNVANVNINVGLAPYYASGSATTTTTSGTFGVGTSGTIASCTSFSASQGIYIAGAGAAAANYIGTVVSCSAGALVITPATSTSVANGTLVQHDDTAAIQAAITALASSGGTIFFSDGFYRANGAFQDVSHANAVLLMPVVAYYGNAAPVSIALVGATPPVQNPRPFVGDTFPAYVGGVVIQSDKTGGNLIGAYNSTVDPFGDHFTGVLLTLRNLTLRTYTNPNLTAVDARLVAQAQIENVTVDVGQTGDPIQPTHSNAVGIYTPGDKNNGYNVLKNIEVEGYYYGVVSSEHTYLDYVSVYVTLHAIQMASGSIPAYGSRVFIQDCPYGLEGVSGATPLYFSELSFEQVAGRPAWTNITAHIDDASNFLNTNPVILAPTIASFTNATHTHTNAAGGGTLAEASLALTDITTNNATVSQHGFVPKLSGGSTDCFLGNGNWGTCPGAGAGGGTVTSVATTSPISGGTFTTAGTISLLTNVDFGFTAGQSVSLANVATAQTAGLSAINSNATPAAAGAQQYSPCVLLTARGWATGSGGSSQTSDWCVQSTPVQGSTNPTGFLTFYSRVNGGSWISQFSMGDSASGTSAATGAFSSGGTVTGTGLRTTGGAAITGGVAARYFADLANTKGYWDTGVANFNWISENNVVGNTNVGIRAKTSQTANLLSFLAAGSTTPLTAVTVTGGVQLASIAFASLPTCTASTVNATNVQVGTFIFCNDCKNFTDDTTGTYDAAAASGGHGTSVLCTGTTPGWRNH